MSTVSSFSFFLHLLLCHGSLLVLHQGVEGWRGGASGKFCPGAKTCLTVMFTLELWMYLEHTTQSSSANGSTTESACSAEAGLLPSASTVVWPWAATRIRGTAWYRSRLWPDITITSPLCTYMAVGGACLQRPPRRKMADCPKLSHEKKTTVRCRTLLLQ